MANKSGTAIRERGKARMENILKAGQKILVTEGHAALSLRRIADELGISNGNVTYYFPNKDSLLRGLIEDLQATHDAQFERENRQFPDEPMGRYQSYVDYVIEDSKNPVTRAFFYQLWALSTHNAVARELRGRVYKQFIGQVLGVLTPLTTHLDAAERHTRALTFVTLIEGAHVTMEFGSELVEDRQALEEAVRNHALHIATSPARES